VAAAAEIEQTMSIKGDRLARLMDALEVMRDRADNVRLVRVMSGENPPPGAKKQGEFYYMVDLLPHREARPRGRGDGRNRSNGGKGGFGAAAGRGRGGGGGGGGDRRRADPAVAAVPGGGGGSGWPAPGRP
jgi:hypothetical protein